jgi:serine/threonine-protein kinase
VPPPAPPVALPPPPPPAPPAEPEDDGKGPRGWFNEKLPDRLKEGKEKPLYLWDTGHGFEIELVYVPPGDFIMGSDDPEAYEDEKPKHKHPMPRGYWIGRTNLSWKEYMPFCEETKREKPPRPPWAEDDHPVISVSWDDSKAFCDWAGVVLPTEAEWEKAARGTDGRKFPWGDEFDANKLNAQNRVGHTTPGNAFPEGASPYGVLDIEGNVWQWCAEWYEQRAYDRYKRGDVKLLETGSDRAWRGSRWRDTNSTALGGKFDEKASQATCRVSVRGGHEPWMHDVCQGFRVAVRNEPKADKGASQPEKKD